MLKKNHDHVYYIFFVNLVEMCLNSIDAHLLVAVGCGCEAFCSHRSQPVPEWPAYGDTLVLFSPVSRMDGLASFCSCGHGFIAVHQQGPHAGTGAPSLFTNHHCSIIQLTITPIKQISKDLKKQPKKQK